jgi:hypothetical protein
MGGNGRDYPYIYILWKIKMYKHVTNHQPDHVVVSWNWHETKSTVSSHQNPSHQWWAPRGPMVTPGTRPSRGKSKRSPQCNCKRLAETCDPCDPSLTHQDQSILYHSIATFQPFWGAILALNSDCIWINVAGKIWEVWLRLRSSCDSSAPGVS